ncbi:initiation factor 2 [Phellopilus nigrolimitatus]|nr:initiation factor 2 [Phellopilus nigrolimitatus]
MLRNDMESQSSYDHMLSADDASLLAMEFNRNPLVDDEAAFDIYASPPHPDYASLPRRPPVVTIMGHVDHGKTTLLDTLRSSAVAKGEAGGITQHIGAFSVPVPGVSASSDIPDTITFLDTPGHAAFSAMRARGAQVTDIIVLVVAADDGVMPQTKEIINLIKNDRGKAGVVVAINKVDKQGADIDKVMTALWAEGIELEVMGGDIPSVEVSGLTGHGLDTLIETISLVAEMQDIRAEADGPAHGYVLESKVQKGLGNTATVLLLRGKLTPSSHIISGTTFAKIRQLMDSQGETVKSSTPGSAVIVTGWKMLPSAGDEVLQGKENDVKRAVENRLRQASLEATLGDAEAINASRRQEREEREQRAQNTLEEAAHAPVMKAMGPKELRLIIKGDVSGSVEALAAAVEGIGNKDAITKVVSTGVGEVGESDVMLARAAEGMIVAFSVNVSRIADQAAAQNSIPVFSSKIIYSVLDEVKARIIKLLPPIIEKRVTGEANVLQLFDINGKGRSIIKVAGCRVSNGIVEKDKHVRVLRNGETIHEGTLSTLRILKRDVTEVKKGLECGMNLSGFDDLRNGDLIQFFQRLEKPGQL